LAALGLVGFAALAGGWDMTGPQTTLIAEGPLARMQYDLFLVTVYVGLFIFVIVGAVLAWTQWRYRARKETENDPVPEQTHGKPAVEISLILASIALLVIIAIPTVRGVRMMGTVPTDQGEPLRITATGLQWWFRFEYPETGVITANELVIPAGRPIRIDLRTMDVGHSFWVPRLAGKIDMIRNRPNWMWIKADSPGYFWGHCAEFCGESHTYMRFRVVALPEAEFAQWVERQRANARDVSADTPSEPAGATSVAHGDTAAPAFFVAGPANVARSIIESKFEEFRTRQNPPPVVDNAPLIAEGRALFSSLGCVACHAIRGHGAAGVSGPELTHFASRTTLAAAVLDNTPANLRRWLRENNEIKPGNLMWIGYSDQARRMTEAQAHALATYLESLR
jgi:cytochrome c oxidase subunit 2